MLESYARSFCAFLDDSIARLFPTQKEYLTDPRQLLIAAAKDTASEGSSTLVTLTLDREQPTLYATYIGDSSYLILRK